MYVRENFILDRRAPICQSNNLFQRKAPQLGVDEIVKITEEHYTSVWMCFHYLDERGNNVVGANKFTSAWGVIHNADQNVRKIAWHALISHQ